MKFSTLFLYSLSEFKLETLNKNRDQRFKPINTNVSQPRNRRVEYPAGFFYNFPWFYKPLGKSKYVSNKLPNRYNWLPENNVRKYRSTRESVHAQNKNTSS